MNKRKRNRKPQPTTTEEQETTALREALLETREGRALVNELQRYKKEVASYYSGAKPKEETP